MLVDDFVVTNTEVTVGFFDFYGTANYRNYFTQQRRKKEKRLDIVCFLPPYIFIGLQYFVVIVMYGLVWLGLCY